MHVPCQQQQQSPPFHQTVSEIPIQYRRQAPRPVETQPGWIRRQQCSTGHLFSINSSPPTSNRVRARATTTPTKSQESMEVAQHSRSLFARSTVEQLRSISTLIEASEKLISLERRYGRVPPEVALQRVLQAPEATSISHDADQFSRSLCQKISVPDTHIPREPQRVEAVSTSRSTAAGQAERRARSSEMQIRHPLLPDHSL